MALPQRARCKELGAMGVVKRVLECMGGWWQPISPGLGMHPRRRMASHAKQAANGAAS